MKLRNKKTGEIWDIGKVLTYDYPSYETLKQLNEDWEDYKPLIKDEKARKAVRAFSEVIQEKKHILVIKLWERGIAEFSNGSCFWMRLPVSNETMNALEDRTYYTITELCGEEEE